MFQTVTQSHAESDEHWCSYVIDVTRQHGETKKNDTKNRKILKSIRWVHLTETVQQEHTARGAIYRYFWIVEYVHRLTCFNVLSIDLFLKKKMKLQAFFACVLIFSCHCPSVQD